MVWQTRSRFTRIFGWQSAWVYVNSEYHSPDQSFSDEIHVMRVWRITQLLEISYLTNLINLNCPLSSNLYMQNHPKSCLANTLSLTVSNRGLPRRKSFWYKKLPLPPEMTYQPIITLSSNIHTHKKSFPFWKGLCWLILPKASASLKYLSALFFFECEKV